jgi:ABC-type lipoprotein release transport system permease subunit
MMVSFVVGVTNAVVLGFAVSTAGLAVSMWSALRAAKQDPGEALR